MSLLFQIRLILLLTGSGGYRDALLYCFSLRRGSLLNQAGTVTISPDTCYSERLPFICEIGETVVIVKHITSVRVNENYDMPHTTFDKRFSCL